MPTPEIPAELELDLLREVNERDGLDCRDDELLDHHRTEVYRWAIATAWRAGRESAGRLIEADTKTHYEVQVWWSDGGTDEWDHVGTEEGAIASAHRKAGATFGIDKVVRSEARSFQQHTYRVEEKGRFGDWERVDD